MLSIEFAKHELASKLSALEAPRLPHALAGSADMLAVRDHLVELAKVVDAYVLTIGQEVKDSTTSIFCADLFKNVLADALAGNALYELEATAEEIDQHALAGVNHD